MKSAVIAVALILFGSMAFGRVVANDLKTKITVHTQTINKAVEEQS